MTGGVTGGVTGDVTGDGVLLLTRTDVRGLASVRDYYDAAAEAFRAVAAGRVHSPSPMEIEGNLGAFHAKGASMDIGGRRLAALKLNGNFPENAKRFGLPTIQGAILLCDADNGALLAILDTIEITLRRTAAASALAADLLARKDAKTLLICGCGVQGRAHAEALAPVRDFKRAYVHDIEHEKASKLAAELTTGLGISFNAIRDLCEAAALCDVIATTTPSNTPCLLPAHVGAGVFIAAVGADNPAKNEIAPDLMRQSAVITDVTRQCEIMGDLRAAIGAKAMTRDDVRAELCEIAVGKKAGRMADDEIIIFDSTGAAFQDLAAAAMIYERALKTGVGARLALGS